METVVVFPGAFGPSSPIVFNEPVRRLTPQPQHLSVALLEGLDFQHTSRSVASRDEMLPAYFRKKKPPGTLFRCPKNKGGLNRRPDKTCSSPYLPAMGSIVLLSSTVVLGAGLLGAERPPPP